MSWQGDAACKGMDVNMFFPEPGFNGNADAQKARAICATCPVKQQCLDDAIIYQYEQGIFGGMSQKERYVYLKQHPTRYRKEKTLKHGTKFAYRWELQAVKEGIIERTCDKCRAYNAEQKSKAVTA